MRPYPELLKGLPWSIEYVLPHQGSCDVDKHILYVPSGSSPLDRSIRLHELSHAKWSDGKKPSDVSMIAYQTAENVWVNTQTARAGVLWPSLRLTDLPIKVLKEMIKLVSPEEQSRAIAALTFQTWQPAIQFSLKSLASKLGANRIDQRKIANFFEKYRQNNPYKFARAFDRTWPELQHNSKPLIPWKKKTIVDAAGSLRSGKWGIANLLTPPRTIDLFSSFHRHTDTGTTIGCIERMCTDQQIFYIKRPRKYTARWKSVLVDCSFSMGWGVDSLIKFVENLPSAWIALYGAQYSDEGDIFIFASNGRRTARSLVIDWLKTGVTANVIDGPALSLLSIQPTPRAWISDGGATFVGDNRVEQAEPLALSFCDTHGIQLIDPRDVRRGMDA